MRRAASWDGIAPMYATADEFRPVSPDEVAAIVGEIAATRGLAGFDVVVWAVAPDAERRAAYRGAGVTWLVEGPAPGEDWLDDAMSIAVQGPPH